MPNPGDPFLAPNERSIETQIVSIFFLQFDMVFGIVNPFSWIFIAISSEKGCLISMLFLLTLHWPRSDSKVFPACWILIGKDSGASKEIFNHPVKLRPCLLGGRVTLVRGLKDSPGLQATFTGRVTLLPETTLRLLRFGKYDQISKLESNLFPKQTYDKLWKNLMFSGS